MSASLRSRPTNSDASSSGSVSTGVPDTGDNDRPTARRLAEALQRLLGRSAAVEVSVAATTVVVELPDADFAITIRGRDSLSEIRLTIAATVRAPEPDLSTWWTRWDLTTEESQLATAALDEIQTHRRRFQEMVADSRAAGDAVKATCDDLRSSHPECR